MSGDIGRGATREAIAFALRLASISEKPPGLCFTYCVMELTNAKIEYHLC